jgi:hypothetical protein
MARDWLEWHQKYDQPGSSLPRRLAVVQECLGRALSDIAGCGSGEVRLISMCAGEGLDVLPILAAHDQGDRVRALLVEIDPRLAGRAREAAGERGLSRVEVRTADAGITDAYLDFAPAHLVLACGVFGNITNADVRGTIAALPSLLAPGGVVIWTRGRPDDGTEPSQRVRTWFAADGFTELAFAAPDDATFRVGMHQLAAAPASAPVPSSRLFSFV